MLKFAVRTALYAFTLLLINVATYAVVTWNQSLCVYPPEGDSIAIPIGGTVMLSVRAAPYLLVLAMLGNLVHIHSWNLSTRRRRLVGTAIFVVFYSPGILGALLGTTYWVGPNHYSISATYALAAAALLAFLIVDVRHLFCSGPRTEARK